MSDRDTNLGGPATAPSIHNAEDLIKIDRLTRENKLLRESARLDAVLLDAMQKSRRMHTDRVKLLELQIDRLDNLRRDFCQCFGNGA